MSMSISISNATFVNFADLINSKSLQDQAIHGFITSLLKTIFGKSIGEIIIDKECETEQNQKIIQESWEFIELNFNVPKRVKNTQKLVRQTFKYVVDTLNQRYSFQKPLEFIPKDDRKRIDGKVVNVAYSILKMN